MRQGGNGILHHVVHFILVLNTDAVVIEFNSANLIVPAGDAQDPMKVCPRQAYRPPQLVEKESVVKNGQSGVQKTHHFAWIPNVRDSTLSNPHQTSVVDSHPVPLAIFDQKGREIARIMRMVM
ncbi:hypothetical protein GLAREA_12234 [Glarea lozoyensis ATCC 20868]|uniref:Uncharacterized protein n=1 Tax=Glarea lozoyensis (strain ATCC 20868 / MF5171) TaxID=1116229 RepID=S3DYP6_GLAL2|nr:uncharacterized protein GLAREA_12234 [Glarea lozoyensis ATCC 20868]EPE31478.1 hypothetical protein GLAREA_12234 [Glarea lozoyensis ATCC 20868]